MGFKTGGGQTLTGCLGERRDERVPDPVLAMTVRISAGAVEPPIVKGFAMLSLKEVQKLDQAHNPAFHFYLPHCIGRCRAVDFRRQTLPNL